MFSFIVASKKEMEKEAIQSRKMLEIVLALETNIKKV